MMQVAAIRRHRDARVSEAGAALVARHQGGSARSDERHLRLVASITSPRCEVAPGGRRRQRRPKVVLAPEESIDNRDIDTTGAGVLDLGWRPLAPAVDPSPSVVPVDDVAASGLRPVRLRITRRGRLLVTALVVAAAALLAALSLQQVSLPSATAMVPLSVVQEPAAPRTISVLPGQTLWQIARQTAPEADPRDVVLEFRELNNLPDSRVYAGQVLEVPQP